MDLDYVFNTPTRDDWRLFTAMALLSMGLLGFALVRGYMRRTQWAALSAAAVGLGLLVWAGVSP